MRGLVLDLFTDDPVVMSSSPFPVIESGLEQEHDDDDTLHATAAGHIHLEWIN